MAQVPKVSSGDVDRVIEAWQARQARPRKVTAEFREKVTARLRLGYSADDLVLMFRWVWESNERNPRWLRGENPDGVKYLTMDNLLVKDKLSDRVAAAQDWADRQGSSADDAEPLAVRGPFALLRGGIARPSRG